MTHEHLLDEFRKSFSATPTTACRESDCSECGGCFFPKSPLPPSQPWESGTPAASRNGSFRKVRIFYEKWDDYRYFSHLSMMQYIERLLRRTALRFDHSVGFHPRIKMASLPPLPVHARSRSEVVEVWVASDLGETRLLDVLGAQSEDFRFKEVRFADGRPSLGKDLHFMEYDILGADMDKTGEIEPLLIESDEISCSQGVLHLKLDYSLQGQQRFARISKLLDPQREKAHQLVRTHVWFKNEK
jgi:hypothetical protein